jgi:hypothetical protein
MSINFIKVTIAPILMGEKRFCVICDKDVEIVKVITRGNYDVQILSCDHIGRKLNLSREKKGDIRITFLAHPGLMSIAAYVFNHQDVIGISTVFNSFPEFDGFDLAAVFALLGF